MTPTVRIRRIRHGAGIVALLLGAGPAVADILEFSPPRAGDPPAALRVVNLSKMPATLHTMTWRFAGACTARRVLGVEVAPGASALVQPDNAAELLACAAGGAGAAARELAGFARPPAAPGSAMARATPKLGAGVRSAAVELDAEIELPQRRLTQRAALQLLYR